MKEIEIIIRRFLLKLLLFLKINEKKKRLPKLSGESKILFIRLNRIGDALVTTPLLKEIKSQIGCKVYILASKQNYFIFNNPELSDEIIIYNKKIKRLSALLKMINDAKFDVIVDLHDDISTTVSYLIAFARCEHKLGLSKGNDKIYTNLIPKLDPSEFHVVKRMMEFVKPFHLSYDPKKVNINYFTSIESDKVAETFIEKHFSEKKLLLGINISAGSDARFWGTDKYKELISLLSQYDINIMLMCLKNDLRKAWEIVGLNYPTFYRHVFDEFAAMIKNLNILFTPDTSIIHVASAFEIPVFGLYVKYNTNDMIWSPYRSLFECVITIEPILENIKFETVKEKFLPFFEKLYYEYKQDS